MKVKQRCHNIIRHATDYFESAKLFNEGNNAIFFSKFSWWKSWKTEFCKFNNFKGNRLKRKETCSKDVYWTWIDFKIWLCRWTSVEVACSNTQEEFKFYISKECSTKKKVNLNISELFSSIELTDKLLC